MRPLLLSLIFFLFIGCMGMMPFMMMPTMSGLSSDNEDNLKQTHHGLFDDDDDDGPPVYYTRLDPVMLDTPEEQAQKEQANLEKQLGGKVKEPKKPQVGQTSGLSSQDIQGTPMPNGIEIKRTQVMEELKSTQQAYAKEPKKIQESYHTLLNYCAKNALFNELGAHLIIRASETKQCARMQKAYFVVLSQHYSQIKPINQPKVALHDIIVGCDTHIDHQKILQSAFFARLKPDLTSPKDRYLLRRFTHAKPLDGDKLHDLLEDPKLGEKFYRCQYFIQLK
ncbi:hypothetical protein NHP190003_11860 [Helicobacter sp. NHP19-003]|uniref:Lipoprotein n=1 Tax=Helicobacter gastrocanis TaxID=2849641 RepID=A0ABM7SB92_9HELI|nr:hypothetical protein [Helicobacter sp. NHP19-003]BCZ17904.1 hypothetical protein NHP190003_11860 [Helicobacter sp. NHP19-003]